MNVVALFAAGAAVLGLILAVNGGFKLADSLREPEDSPRPRRLDPAPLLPSTLVGPDEAQARDEAVDEPQNRADLNAESDSLDDLTDGPLVTAVTTQVERLDVPTSALVGTNPGGEQLVVPINQPGRSTLLAFMGSGCGACAHFWTDFDSPEADELLGTSIDLAIVTRGIGREDPDAIGALASGRRTTVMCSEVWERYGVQWNPYFILVDGDSLEVVTEGTAQSWDELVALVTQQDSSEPQLDGIPDDAFPMSWVDPRVRVEWVESEDLRLVATERIEPGEVVIVWAGVHTSPVEAEAFLGHNTKWRGIVLDDSTRLLQSEHDTALAVEHSCDPSAWLEGPYTVVSRRPIDASEAITMDFATWIGDPTWDLRCSCQSATCRGTVSGTDWRRADLQATYREHWSPYVAALVEGEGGDAG